MDFLNCCSRPPCVNLLLLSKHPTKLPKPSFQHNYSPNSITIHKNNILLSSHSKSKNLDQTLQLFHLLSDRDTVTWNTIISACLRHAHFTYALHLFFDMILSLSYQPDSLTFRLVLKACIETNNYPLALQIHACLIKLQGWRSLDIITNTCLIKLYCKFGLTDIAHEVFDRIPIRDVVAYTAMMVAYTEVNDWEKALWVFIDMLEKDGLEPNEFAFSCVLSACAGISSLFEGKQIHAFVIKVSRQSNVFVGTSLINMYAKCNRMDFAEEAFLEISAPNVVSWNALLAGCSGSEEAIKFFSLMRESDASPDHLTIATVLRACKDVSLSSALQIHGLVMKMLGDEVDVYLGGALFEIYVDHSLPCDAGRVFQYIHGKDITVFNLAIQGFARNGHTAEAVSLFHEALEIGIEPNEATLVSLMIIVESLNQGKQLHALVTKFGFSNSDEAGYGASIASSLIKVYTEFHCLDKAIRLFEKIHSPDLVLWTSLISGFSQSGESQEALELFVLMLFEGLAEPPNHYTFSSILCACANLAAVEEGKQIHSHIIKSSHQIGSDLFIASGLIDMYAKCGCITEARSLFDKMPVRDLASWNAIITGLAQHGYAEVAIETFNELLNMPNLVPNHITFIGMLSACSRCGLLEEGYSYFQLIREPTINHYACLIDLLARAGHLEEARSLIKKMPFNPNEIIWSSLLAASSIHGNIELGEYSAKHLLLLNPKDPGTYIALSNIYAAEGKWEDVHKIRKLMREQGASKNPGFSWLQVNGSTKVFFTV